MKIRPVSLGRKDMTKLRRFSQFLEHIYTHITFVIIINW